MAASTELQIDRPHCRAICDEIGWRLRIMLDRETTPLPPRLQALLLRLAAQELAGSPSIAPSTDDTIRQDRAEDGTGPILAACVRK